MIRRTALLSSLAWALLLPLVGQEAPTYLTPPEVVKGLLDRNRHYDVLNNLSPDGNTFLIPVRDEFTDLQTMSRKTYRLAMLEFLPQANREWRLSNYGVSGLRVFSMADRTFSKIDLPQTLLSDMVFSPDGKKLAFLRHLEQGSQVWTADLATGRAEALSPRFVMATLAAVARRGAGPPSRLLQWTPEGTVLTLLVPEGRGPEPQDPAIPKGPTIRRTRDKATPTRTYPFLIKNAHEADLFRYYTTSQLAELAPGRAPRKVGAPGMYREFSLSPDGRHILAERIEGQLSYIVPYSDFGRRLEVLDRSGRVLSTVREIPLHEAMSRGDNGGGPERDLPRDVKWRPDGKGLSMLWRTPRPKDAKQDGDDGEAAETGPRKDRLMLSREPFDPQQALTLVEEEKTISSALYSRDGRWAIATLQGREEGRRQRRITAFDLRQSPPRAVVVVDDYDSGNPLKDPGSIISARSGNGIEWALQSGDGDSFYLEGGGWRDDYRPRPFVDRVSVAGADKVRVFEGSDAMFERPLAFPDPDLKQLVISRESSDVFPDSWLWSADAAAAKLTDNQDPFPELAESKRIEFDFVRRDGLKIQGHMWLPIGYQEGTRVPGVFWTYPREYRSKKDYRQTTYRRHNLNRFSQLNYRNASQIWLTQGYAVIEPDIPIVGKGRDYNDNYVAHLVDSMYAAIRHVDKMGAVDIDRLGHGGHSYGAFATANILARTPFFKAGIAGDGAFNRTLTPMSFQRENRFVWDATDIYIEMSPFFQADHIDTPLLMYHGEQDNNSGTFLIQSYRLIQALTGLGKTAVLYVYPFESHGPRVKETYYDLWSRWLEWFDRYVKNSEVTDSQTG